jgi:hypothetical protein
MDDYQYIGGLFFRKIHVGHDVALQIIETNHNRLKTNQKNKVKSASINHHDGLFQRDC